MPPNLKIDGFITSKYLFGAPASKLETVVKAQLSKATFVPPDYPDYVFSSPLKTFQERQLTIFKGKLNENGKDESIIVYLIYQRSRIRLMRVLPQWFMKRAVVLPLNQT